MPQKLAFFPYLYKLCYHWLCLVSLIVGSSYAPLRAQEKAPTQPQPVQTVESSTVPLKFVPAHIMAWWLDPKNNRRPIEYGGGQVSNPYRTNGLPIHLSINALGIERVAPLEQQNAISVFGNKEAVGKLQPSVDLLDTPLRYFELEMRTITVRGEDADKFVSDAVPPFPGMRFGKGDVEGLLRKLEQQNKAVVSTAVRVKTVEDGWAPLTNSGTVKIGLSTGASFVMHTIETLNVIPSSSGTIVLRMWWSREASSQGPLPEPHQMLEGPIPALVQVADGQTLAIVGMASNLDPRYASHERKRNMSVSVYLLRVRRVAAPKP